MNTESKNYIANLGENYHKLLSGNFRRDWAEELIQIPNLSTANILDAGCGFGLYTKLMRELTQGEVFGIDLTEDMIIAAQKEQENLSKKIIYKQGDLNHDICRIVRRDAEYFDVIISCWVLVHAQTQAILGNMIKNIFNALKKGGVFIGLTLNPDISLQDMVELEKDGIIHERKVREAPLSDGEKLHVKILDPETKELTWEVDNHYYSREVYTKAFLEAGFSKVEFIPQRRPQVPTGNYYVDEVTLDGIIFKAYK